MYQVQPALLGCAMYNTGLEWAATCC